MPHAPVGASDPVPAGSEEETSTHLGGLRRIGNAGLRVLLGGSLAGLLLFGLLQSDGISTWLVNRLAAHFNPYPGTELAVQRVGGSWIRSLHLQELRLIPGEDGGPEIRLASLDIRFRLLPLVRRRLEIRQVTITGLTANLTQLPDSTWDFLLPFQGPEDRPAVEEDEAGSGFRFRSGPVRIQDASASLHFAPPDSLAGPEALVVEELAVALDGLEVGGGALFARLDTLHARFLPPRETSDRVTLDGKGTLEEGRVVVSGLLLRSGLSDVSAAGTFSLGTDEEDRLREIDVRVRAAPLAFRDLSGFVRTLDPTVSARGDVRIGGSTSRLELDARTTFSDGGRLVLVGAATPTTVGPVDYTLDASVEALRLESLLGEGRIGGILQGRVTADMEGDDLSSLQGTLSVAMEGLTFEGKAIRPLSASGRFLDGEAELEADLGVEGVGQGSVSVSGRPLDPEPTLRLQGRIAQASSQRATPGGPAELGGLEGLQADVTLQTRGFSADSAVAQLELTTLEGMFRTLPLGGGLWRASWNRGDGTIRFSQPLGRGEVSGGGTVVWRGGSVTPIGGERVLRLSVPNLLARDLDLSGLLGDSLPSRLNGSAALVVEGTGTDFRGMEGELRLRLEESALRGVRVDSALARSRLNAGDLSAALEVWGAAAESAEGELPGGEGPRDGEIPDDSALEEDGPRERPRPRRPGGRAVAEIRGRPFDAAPFLVLDSVRFERLDLGPFIGVESDLTGRASGRLDGFDPRTAEFSGGLDLSSSSVGPAPLDSASLALSLSEGEVRAAGNLRSPGGTVTLQGSAFPFREPAEFRLIDLSAREVDLGTLLDAGDLGSDLNLDIDLYVRGTSPDDLAADGHLLILPSRLNEGVVREGSFTLTVAGGQGSARGEIRTAEGEVTLTGLASLRDGFDDLIATAAVNLPDLGAFMGRAGPGAEAGGGVEIAWTSRDGLEASVDLQGRVEGAAIDTLLLRGTIGRAALRLDTLLLRSEIADADGGGRFALEDHPEETLASDLSLTLDIRNLSPLGPLLGIEDLDLRSGSGKADVSGPAGSPALTARLDLGPWSVKGVSGDSASLALTHRPEEVALSLWLQEPGEQGFIDLALRADPRPGERQGTLERLEASGPGALWALEGPVPFSWREGFRIDGLSVVSEGGRISLDGSVDRRGDQDLTLTVETARLSALTVLLGMEDLMLVADGDLRLTGPAASPMLDGQLRIDTGIRDGASTTADARFRVSDGSLTLNVQARDTTGGRVLLEGTVPMTFSLAPGTASSPGGHGTSDPLFAEAEEGVDLTLRAEDFDISWARALVPHGAIDALAGTLSADLRAGGTLQEPALEGNIGLSGGLLRLPASRTRYEDIELATELQNDGIRIREARVVSGAGSADIEGFISLRAFKPDTLGVRARMDRFSAWNSPTAEATLTGTLAVGGSIREPLITGRLNLEGSKVSLDGVSSGDEVRAVELTEADYQMLEDYFGYEPERVEFEPSDLLERFGLDLTLDFDRDVWVNRSRQPRVALEARGNVELQKEPGGPLRVLGTVETLPDRSYFRQFGRRFSVQEGQLSLSGDPADFSFRLEAQWEVPDYANPDEAAVVINLSVAGDADALELTLSSEPEMDEADIVSYLATGKPQSALGSSEPAEVAGLGTSMAMGAMAGVLEGLASEAVELDVVEVQVDPLKGATLIAGRYVNPDLYLGFRQPVTLSEDKRRRQTLDSEVELEYRWFQWLTMNIQGGASELRFYLKTRYAY